VRSNAIRSRKTSPGTHRSPRSIVILVRDLADKPHDVALAELAANQALRARRAGRTGCHITAGQRRAQQAGAPTGKLLNRRRLAHPRERRERPTLRKPKATADATTRKSRRPADTNRRDAQIAKGSRYETFAAIAQIRRRIHWTSRKKQVPRCVPRPHTPPFLRQGRRERKKRAGLRSLPLSGQAG